MNNPKEMDSETNINQSRFQIGDRVKFKKDRSVGKVHSLAQTVLGCQATDTVQVFWFDSNVFADIDPAALEKI